MSNTLRDILGCQCNFNGTNDGKAYNLKTEAHEDCSCVAKLQAIEAYIAERVIKELEVVLIVGSEEPHGGSRFDITERYLRDRLDQLKSNERGSEYTPDYINESIDRNS